MKMLFRFLGFLFAVGTIFFIVGVAGAAALIWHFSKDLPDYSQLQNYEPPVMTRVHAADGSLLAEYANERRLYLPIQAIPKLVTNAFIAAEDKNFYQHPGIDIYGIARAALLYVQNLGSSRRPQGASTITQQVAKNFLLDERGIDHPQDQGSAAGAAHRADLFEGQNPRTLSQPNLSRRRRLWRGGRIAPVLRQVGARADDRRGRLSRRTAQGPEQLQSIPPPRRGDRRAATTSSTAWSRTATSPPRPARRPRKSRSTSRCGRPARTRSRRNISPRKSAATSSRTTARRSFTRAGSRCAPRWIPSCRCWRARP